MKNIYHNRAAVYHTEELVRNGSKLDMVNNLCSG